MRKLAALVLTLAGLQVACANCVPQPTLNSLSPASATAGGAQFLLIVSGLNFEKNAQVYWNGSRRVTTYVASNRVEAVITSADLAQPGSASVVVINPAGNSPTSVSGSLGIDECRTKSSGVLTFEILP